MEILETFPRVFCFQKSRINENGSGKPQCTLCTIIVERTLETRLMVVFIPLSGNKNWLGPWTRIVSEHNGKYWTWVCYRVCSVKDWILVRMEGTVYLAPFRDRLCGKNSSSLLMNCYSMYLVYLGGPSIKPGTWNIPEHQIIMIIVRTICKIKFSKRKLTKMNWYLLKLWKNIFGGRGVGRGGVGSVGYSFNWPKWVWAPLLSRQLRHMAL